MPLSDAIFRDPSLIRRLGNLTASSTSEVLLSARDYTEQDSEEQRSIKSSSVQDKPTGSGAHEVRITYLTSAYELKTVDVILDGTTRVTVPPTDLRFVEDYRIIKGGAAAGAISLLETASGPQNEFVGIGVGTYNAFLCHHYVPAGKSGWVFGWASSVDDETKFKLMGRATYGANVVDEHWDLVNLMGITTPPGLLSFEKKLIAVPFGE